MQKSINATPAFDGAMLRKFYDMGKNDSLCFLYLTLDPAGACAFAVGRG